MTFPLSVVFLCNFCDTLPNPVIKFKQYFVPILPLILPFHLLTGPIWGLPNVTFTFICNFKCYCHLLNLCTCPPSEPHTTNIYKNRQTQMCKTFRNTPSQQGVICSLFPPTYPPPTPSPLSLIIQQCANMCLKLNQINKIQG